MIELQELRRYRRDLHRIPELDFDLPQTIAYIEGVLAPLACEVTHPCPSCVCAFFDAGVALRMPRRFAPIWTPCPSRR